MRAGLAASAAAHAILISAAIIGLRGAEPLRPQPIEAISIDLVPVSNHTTIQAGSEQSQVIDTPAPSVVDTPKPAELAQRTGTTQEDQPKPLDAPKPSPAPTEQTAPQPAPTPKPQPNPKPASVPKPQPEPQPQKQPAPEPAPSTPVLATTPQSAAPQEVAPQPVVRTAQLDKLRADFKKQQQEQAAKAAEQKAQKQADAQKISDIINAEKSRGATTGSGGKQSAGKASGQAAELTQSELGALIAQMRRCWNPTLAERNDAVVIQLLVAMNRDGTVNGMPQILTNISGNPMLGLSARTAARKVAGCGPFNLPSDKYDRWREIDVTLDASQAN